MAEQVQEVIQAFREAPAVNQASCTSSAMYSFAKLRQHFTDIYSTCIKILHTTDTTYYLQYYIHSTTMA